MRLLNKTVIVTGAGDGIGEAIALECAREGARVVVSSRRAVNGQPVADAICQSGGEAVFVQCDVSKEDDVRSMVNTAILKFNKVDILINNAGVNFVKNFEDCLPEDWDRVMGTDLRGTYLCSWYALPHMVQQGGGVILNITTVHTLACMPGAAPYDAAKWGVVGLTKSMAVEFADRKIRVNALSPGLIATRIWDDIQNASEELDACHSYWKANIPMGRVGESLEIAKAAVFLVSDDASYITGANLLADGGMTSQLVSKPYYESKSLEGGQRV
ncbi:MAG: glucose 1-dehydrogenase [Eubacteriales bacterium]